MSVDRLLSSHSLTVCTCTVSRSQTVDRIDQRRLCVFSYHEFTELWFISTPPHTHPAININHTAHIPTPRRHTPGSAVDTRSMNVYRQLKKNSSIQLPVWERFMTQPYKMFCESHEHGLNHSTGWSRICIWIVLGFMARKDAVVQGGVKHIVFHNQFSIV